MFGIQFSIFTKMYEIVYYAWNYVYCIHYAHFVKLEYHYTLLYSTVLIAAFSDFVQTCLCPLSSMHCLFVFLFVPSLSSCHEKVALYLGRNRTHFRVVHFRVFRF